MVIAQTQKPSLTPFFDARRFAQGKPIELIHGQALLAMIREAQSEAQSTASTPQLAPSNTSRQPDGPPDCPQAALSWSNATIVAPGMRSGAARSTRVVAVLDPLNQMRLLIVVRKLSLTLFWKPMTC